MSDTVKILEIKRDNEVKSDKKGKKNFKPIQDVWFVDETSTHDNTYKTDELGKVIENVKIIDDKISIIKNANANFFIPPRVKKDFNRIVNDVPESISIIENSEPTLSKLPQQIIELRKNDFLSQQNMKEKLLEKLNIQLDTTVEKINSSNENINMRQKIIEDKENRFKKDSNFVSLEKNNKENSIQILSNNTENSISDTFETVEINDKTAIIVPKNENNKNKDDTIMPVVYNNDFTLSNTVDDLKKEIIEPKNKKLNISHNSSDDTTMLVNNLLSEMNRVNNNVNNSDQSEFDDFFNMFKASKENKRLKKIADKENKKLMKKKGVKFEK